MSGKNATRLISTVDEIQACLRSQSPDGLLHGLRALRNRFSVWPNELPIGPQDERLVLARQWLTNVPGAYDLFAVWDSLGPRQTSLISLVLSILSSLLTLLTSHYTDQALGYPVTKALLAPSALRRLNSYISGANAETTLVALRLFNTLSSFGGGREKKSILEGFAWESKSLHKILSMRRKANPEPLSKPGTDLPAFQTKLTHVDIRTMYILFILSFVSPGVATQIKMTFLEQHRDAFISIFKGLVQDAVMVVQTILEACWAGIWLDAKLKRTLKIGIFNETTIFQIAKLYDRALPDDAEKEHHPADLAHHFLLAICTRPGTGVCFKDRGWYLRESETDDTPTEDHAGSRKGGKIYNKILCNILKGLKVNEDGRQQELATKILEACPELVASYWSNAALTLEPRLSSKWIINFSFLGSIISLPIPSQTFLLARNSLETSPNSSESFPLYHPSPPPLHNIIENIFPSTCPKSHFSRGLQAGGLVQHCTALTLAKCLIKYEKVIALFMDIEGTLEEQGQGQWSKRHDEIQKEARRRVPDFQVIVASSQQKDINPMKAPLLSESAHRLLWLYYRVLPSLVAEARFDVGKLLLHYCDLPTTRSEDDDPEQPLQVDGSSKLANVQKLHILRLLKESDQFTWSGKLGHSSHTPLRILLLQYLTSPQPVIHAELSSLLEHILSQSILFQSDPQEPRLWLASLPRTHRSPNAETPDGAQLTDEGTSVASFLEDCIQRCLKTPYKYMEELDALYATTPADQELEGLDSRPSPLMMTVIEQLKAKVEHALLSPSDLLALLSFTRSLLVRLRGKQQTLNGLHAFAAKIQGIFPNGAPSTGFPSMDSAIRRELRLMEGSVGRSSRRSDFGSPKSSQEVQLFLAQVGQIEPPLSMANRISMAFELVDWIRLIEQPLELGAMTQVINIINILHLPALDQIACYTDPGQHVLWKILASHFQTTMLARDDLDFFLLHLSEEDLDDPNCCNVIVKSVFSALFLQGSQQNHLLANPLVGFGGAFITGYDALKELVFSHLGVFKAIFMVDPPDDPARHAVYSFVRVIVNPVIEADRVIANIESILDPVLQLDDLFRLLDVLPVHASELSNPDVLNIFKSVLLSLREALASNIAADGYLRQRLPQLTILRDIPELSGVSEDLIALGLDASLPEYCFANNLLPNNLRDVALEHVARHAQMRWSRRPQPLFDVKLESLLAQEFWSDATAKIICNTLYQQPHTQITLSTWLHANHCESRSTKHFLAILHAFLDVAMTQEGELQPQDPAPWLPHLRRLLRIAIDGQSPQELRSTAGACVSLLIESVVGLLDIISREVQSLSSSHLTVEFLSLGLRVPQKPQSTFVASLIDYGLSWAINQFTDDQESLHNLHGVISVLDTLICASTTGPKSHLVETALTAVIQHRLSDQVSVCLIASAISKTTLKPLIVNRHLQSIIQHPRFHKLCAPTSPARSAIIKLLHKLFHIHPQNTCQVSHIEPLVKVYYGTLSNSDRNLFSIFHLFEDQRKISTSSLLDTWSYTDGTPSRTALDAIQSLDSALVFKTCLRFPTWRHFEPDSGTALSDSQLYDPLFLIFLFAQMLAHDPPTSAFAWVELFRTNIVSLLLRALSSKDDRIRDVALCQISALWKQLESADLQERALVLHILNLLKDVLPPPSDDAPKRLPTYTTLLLLHALRGIFYPSNFIYPITSRFLLQRPSLDIKDVPMLYGMLYSSSDDWKRERGWIVRFLSDGMVSTDDWRVFKRRHTWDILASLFQSSQDHGLRAGTLEVLANLTCNQQAAASLVLKSALLTWVEFQLDKPNEREHTAWIRILENILTVLDPIKLNASTDGEWRTTICRCFLLLLSATSLPAIAPAILRLSLVPGPPVPILVTLLDKALEHLERMEMPIATPFHYSRTNSTPPKPLHRAPGLHDPSPTEEPLDTWGNV
ncbi:ribosome 60S biogenesis N-terminal-domain-containing protein [Infundibulicybe gibba]|nr:ribosome 60S biogenesis N-terminal-domain-containing protein [Infundibulicybe gibba]